MKDNYGNRRQPIMRILIIGGIILLICLSVCIFLVTVLRSNFENEISMDFQEHHKCSAALIDSTFESISGIVETAALSLSDENKDYSVQRIYNLISEYQTYPDFNHFGYLSVEGNLYWDKNYMNVDELQDDMKEIVAKVLASTDEIMFFADADSETDFKDLIIAYPVVRKNEIKGFFIANTNMNDLLDQPAYHYQNEMGECYIADEKGMILLRSSDANMILKEEKNIKNGLIAYSDGKEATEKQITNMWFLITKNESGYETIRTQRNDSLQISYCALDNVEGAFFISCYNDNLVDDKVQPLIFRSVLSCIFIIVLMIAIIVYVWSTAKNANITIEKLAYEDPITKGKNLNYFKEFAVNVMSVYKETPFVIHRFDIANFRYINEAYGHKKADEILISCIKSFESIFAENELCVRMNADQFLAIIVNDQSANQRLLQFRKKVNEDARSIGVKYPIKFKTGIYQGKKHENNIDVWIDHANVARKSLSGDEKEMTAVYSDRIVTSMQKTNRIESDMQHALATNEFKVFLQPKWDVYLNRVVGAEALVRWIKADGSAIYPDEFIPVFENNGFVEKLDFYMLESVCQLFKQLVDEGRTIFPISVNQSRLLLHSPDYVTNVEKIIKKYNIPENAIELEITETVFQNDRANMIQTMENLKHCGVRLAMDDFGSGFSSLNMLKDAPFDIIKIDREFFSESITSESSQVILQKIVEMANGIGMEVICEGVETAEQVELLKGIGCRSVQGYFYDRPMPAENFVEKYCRINMFN